MTFSVYILFSEKLSRYYIGTTDDLKKRLQDHNDGVYHDAFTIKGAPWILHLHIDGLSSQQAYKIERHIKQMKSKKYIHNLKNYPEMINTLKERYK